MDALQNRVIAGFLCLLLVIAASVAGVASTLLPMRNQVTELFRVGERSAPGIAVDLREIAVQAHNLTVVAGRYLAADYPALTRVHVAGQSLTMAMQGRFSPGEMRRASDELVGAAQALHATLSVLELSDQDQNLAATVMAEINSRVGLISQNTYNQAALSFNRSLTQFPANIMGPIAGVRPLELFA